MGLKNPLDQIQPEDMAAFAKPIADAIERGIDNATKQLIVALHQEFAELKKNSLTLRIGD